MKKRLLILGDSLALPREKPEYCAFEDTWPQILIASKKFIVHQVSIGGATIKDICNQSNYHKLFKPDIVLIQVGVVDCAPRFVHKCEKDILNKIPFLGNRLIAAMNNPLVRKFRKITYTKPNEFKKTISQIKEIFKDSDVFFIGILPILDAYEAILPTMKFNAKRYNSMLSYSGFFIDTQDFSEELIMSDYHHLNTLGHQCLAQIVICNFDI